MNTTIAIQEDTRFMLAQVKEEIGAQSMDETIKSLLSERKKPRKSLFGAFPGMPEFKREDQIDRFA